MEPNAKSGHPILGIILALLGIAVALFLTFIFGAIGGGIALLLGLIGLILGIKARKAGGRGMGAIIVGAVAIVMAILLTVSSVGAITALRDTAEKSKPGSLFAKYASKPYLGLVGIVMNMPQDEEGMQALMDELKELEAMNPVQTEAK